MLNSVCLFSSAGIGELGVKRAGINIVISNEIDLIRHTLYKNNHHSTNCLQGDIWKLKDIIVEEYKKSHPNNELFLVYATPPCQGMSSNGAGKLMDEIRKGNRTPVDIRNRLIIPALDVIKSLHPRWVLFENVPRMRLTEITDDSGYRFNIIKYIEHILGPEYVGGPEIVACEDYGIPQIRKRLITIYTRDPLGQIYYNSNGFTFFPRTETLPQVTLRQAISHLPPLDARLGLNSCLNYHPLHYVPVMDLEKYWWVSKTREGDTAYNNQCVNPKCLYKGNRLHKDVNVEGRWRSSQTTPIYCEKCGELLPRPTMIDKKTGARRLLNGFHSAYRRMRYDEPSNTITQNLLYEASDNKIHPTQNRVLSLLEATIIQTVADYNYDFSINEKPVSKNLIAEILGESVPPRLIEMICKKIVLISNGFGVGLRNRSGSL